MKYPAENWKKLGERVALMRRAAGYHNMTGWVSAVGRSSRVLQGLERGEPVGDATLAAIAKVIGADVADIYATLGEPVGPPEQDAKYVASPGERVEAGESDDAVLRAINAMRADVEKLAGLPEALADLARRMEVVERRTESLDSPEGTP